MHPNVRHGTSGTPVIGTCLCGLLLRERPMEFVPIKWARSSRTQVPAELSVPSNDRPGPIFAVSAMTGDTFVASRRSGRMGMESMSVARYEGRRCCHRPFRMNAGNSGGHVGTRSLAGASPRVSGGVRGVEYPLQMLPADTNENGGEKQEFLEGRRLTRGVFGRVNHVKWVNCTLGALRCCDPALLVDVPRCPRAHFSIEACPLFVRD